MKQKYQIEDIVWFIYNNNVTSHKIEGVILLKWETDGKEKEEIKYCFNSWKAHDGKMTLWLKENQIFSTKEDLIASL